MLKITDYIAVIAGFVGITLFYLIFSGNLTLDYKTSGELPVLEDYLPEEKEVPEVAEYIVLYGEEENSAATENICEMLDELKIEYIAKSTMEQFSDKQREAAKVMLVTTSSVAEAGDASELLRVVEEEGKQIFFTSFSIGEELDEMEKEIGVLRQNGTQKVDGMIVFEGLFVQGMVYYEELPMEVDDVFLDASCTKMIREREEEDTKKQEELIPLLWKKNYGEGKIYVANGPFFEEKSGIGILTGVLSDMKDVFAYPVVNSKSVLMDYYPEYQDLDMEMISNNYNRTAAAFYRDIIWPAMDKIAYSEELIISGRSNEDSTSEDYEGLRLQMLRSESIILSEGEGQLLPVVCEDHWKSDKKRYEMESFSSGMGLATAYLDMRDILGSQTDDPDYEWSSYCLELSKMLQNVYSNNAFLEKRNWLEAEECYKRYLKIEPEFTVSRKEIIIRADGFEDLWHCMLRTDKTPEEGNGYEVEKVGKNAYLIKITQQEVKISLN